MKTQVSTEDLAVCAGKERPSSAPQSIDWRLPAARTGALGAWDRFVGPGYVPAEMRLWSLATPVGGLLAVAHPLAFSAGWSWWRYAVAGAIAADIWGGVAVNTSAPAKRCHHRLEANVASHVIFIAVHAIHVLVVAALFHPKAWAYFVVFVGVLCACAFSVLVAPLYLRRR